MSNFKPVYRLLIDEWAGFTVSAPDLPVWNWVGVDTPSVQASPSLDLFHKHVMLLDTASALQILQAVWQSIQMTHQQLVPCAAVGSEIWS